MEGLKNFLLKDAKPFTSKREVNWEKLKLLGISVLGAVILGIILIPTSEPDRTTFHEKSEKGEGIDLTTVEVDPTLETIKQIQDAQANTRNVHASLDHLYKPDMPAGSSVGARVNDVQNSGMILPRGGGDSRTQLSMGTRISIRLSESLTIGSQTMPVRGTVLRDVESENYVAIPSGSILLGEATFDEASERAQIKWGSIILSDGRERPISAIALGTDGEVGLKGSILSSGMKNALGQTLTRFVGAYAAGSINTGAFGANQGGHLNGMRNAVAQTATAQANDLGEDLQKEKKLLKLNAGLESVGIMTQLFQFRDAGVILGR